MNHLKNVMEEVPEKEQEDVKQLADSWVLIGFD
jgi:hypothetical protein